MVQHESGGGDSTDGEGYDTDNDDLDERVANWSNGGSRPIHYIGMSTRETDPLTGRSKKTMRRQARLVVIMKHQFQGEDIFSPVVGEADTGAPVSFITVALAEDCDLDYTSYRCGNYTDGLRFHDFSGTRVPITGYIDLQVNTASGAEHEYRWTRILVVDEYQGEERLFIVGRNDLRLMEVISENFPMRMTEEAVSLERKARTETLLQMQQDRKEECQRTTEDDLTAGGELTMPIPSENEYFMEDVSEDEIDEDGMDEDEDEFDPAKYDLKKTVLDQAAELHEEEEKRAMVKEQDNMMLLWSMGHNSRGWSHATNIDLGLNKTTRMMKMEMTKQHVYMNMRDAVLFYGGQQIFYIKRILHWSTAELIEWVLREDRTTRGFPNCTDDEMWEAMIGGTWPKEFCCKVAKLEDRRCHLCHNHVAAAVRSAVSEERKTVANAERKTESGERGPTGLPAWVATCDQEQTADPAVDEEIHKEAAELVEEGAACLRAMEQSSAGQEEGDKTAKVLLKIKNISDKVRSRKIEKRRELQERIREREAEIRRKVRELHIAAKEVKEFQKTINKSDGRFRKLGTKERGVGDGGKSGQRGISSNNEPGLHTRVNPVGERRGGTADNGGTSHLVEVPCEARVLQEVAEYSDLPELQQSDAATSDEDEHDDNSANDNDSQDGDTDPADNTMVELADGSAAPDDDDPTTLQARDDADEENGNRTGRAADEGGIRRGEGGVGQTAGRPEGLGRALAKNFF